MSVESRISSPKNMRVGDAVTVQAFGERADGRVAGFRHEGLIESMKRLLSQEEPRKQNLKHRLKVLVEIPGMKGRRQTLPFRPHKVHPM